MQHGQLHIQSILRASLGRLHRTLRASETICFVDLTQDGRGTLKTMFVIEMDSDETQMTRLGMMLSQSCTRLRLKLAREKERQKVNEKAHDKSCLISNDGEFKLQWHEIGIEFHACVDAPYWKRVCAGGERRTLISHPHSQRFAITS